jgi:hypothetical protein
VLYCYTQVLRSEDLVNNKGKSQVTVARLEEVWKRLADRFATVVADTSMITLSLEYAAHFHDIYIDGKEGAKMTGDRMKMLMLTLPFMVRDLIAPEVHLVHVCTLYIHYSWMYIPVCTRFYSSTRLLMQLKLVQVCTNCLTLLTPAMRLWRYSFSAWIGILRLASQAFRSQSCLLQQKAINLLDLLKKNLPDKTGEKAKWNFEKAHSILHKVCEIVLWGNSDNTSCQAPEVSTNVYVHVCTLFIHVPCSATHPSLEIAAG